jgi:hypothetical protein
MAHINSLQAGIFSYLDIYTGADDISGHDDVIEFKNLFNSGVTDIVRMPSVREFPSVGTPANIVNVPVYGQKTSSQVQGQADAPSLEITVNYVPYDMVAFHNLIGQTVAFRFLMSEKSLTLAESTAANIEDGNTHFYFRGKIEAILVNPQLTDATTATVTLSAQSDFFGPDTFAPATP